MNGKAQIFIGVMIPFLGTSIGAAAVYFIKKDIKPRIQKLILGFASGVMIAAAVWSLLIPAIEMTKSIGKTPWIPAVIGFLLGVCSLLAIDTFIPHIHVDSDVPEGIKSKLGKKAMLVLAITIHNIPEGMAVGVVFAGVLANNTAISAAGAFTLAIGIALQDIPEGAIVSVPLMDSGLSKNRAFLYGVLSGAVEPLGAVFTILLTSFVTPALPYILSFAAGAMIYVVVDDLIPESQTGEHSNAGTLGVALGFALMMLLDVALS